MRAQFGEIEVPLEESGTKDLEVDEVLDVELDVVDRVEAHDVIVERAQRRCDPVAA